MSSRGVIPDRWWLLAGAGAAMLASGWLALPLVLVLPLLSPDPVEYLAIANSWVHGAGFVDPVQWHFYLRESAPLPAFAVRAPVVPVLVAAPLVLGASVAQVMVAHAVWASVLVGAMVVVGCRLMRLPAALAAALLVGLSPAWLGVSRTVMTEVTGVGAFLLVLATARRAARSVPGALACCAATVLAWLTRPNLGVLFLAVVGSAVWQLGWREAARRPALWVYGVGFAGLLAAVHLVCHRSAGVAPYAGYGVMAEIFHEAPTLYYRREYVGALAFMQEHPVQIARRMGARLGDIGSILFASPKHLYVGWLLPLALGWTLWRPREALLEHRLVGLAALLSLLIVVLYYGPFDPARFLLFSACAAALFGLSAVDRSAQALERRLGGVIGRRMVRVTSMGLPLLVVAIFLVGTGGKPLRVARGTWQAYFKRGAAAMVPWGKADAKIRELCSHLDADAIVAASGLLPWGLHYWCGNATMVLPVDLLRGPLQRRFLDERNPGYIIADRRSEFAWLRASARVEEIADAGSFAVYQVRNPKPASRPWSAPPPVACAGRVTAPDCLRSPARHRRPTGPPEAPARPAGGR